MWGGEDRDEERVEVGEEVFQEGLKPHRGGEDGEGCVEESVLVSPRAIWAELFST